MVTVNDPSEPVVVVPVPDWHLTCTAPASIAVPVRATPEITKSELVLDELLPPPPPHAARVSREIESKNGRILNNGKIIFNHSKQYHLILTSARAD
jgi:hypothetical protein